MILRRPEYLKQSMTCTMYLQRVLRWWKHAELLGDRFGRDSPFITTMKLIWRRRSVFSCYIHVLADGNERKVDRRKCHLGYGADSCQAAFDSSWAPASGVVGIIEGTWCSIAPLQRVWQEQGYGRSKFLLKSLFGMVSNLLSWPLPSSSSFYSWYLSSSRPSAFLCAPEY